MGPRCSACAKDRLFNSEGDLTEKQGETATPRLTFNRFLRSSQTWPTFNVAV